MFLTLLAVLETLFILLCCLAQPEEFYLFLLYHFFQYLDAVFGGGVMLFSREKSEWKSIWRRGR